MFSLVLGSPVRITQADDEPHTLLPSTHRFYTSPTSDQVTPGCLVSVAGSGPHRMTGWPTGQMLGVPCQCCRVIPHTHHSPHMSGLIPQSVAYSKCRLRTHLQVLPLASNALQSQLPTRHWSFHIEGQGSRSLCKRPKVSVKGPEVQDKLRQGTRIPEQTKGSSFINQSHSEISP